MSATYKGRALVAVGSIAAMLGCVGALAFVGPKPHAAPATPTTTSAPVQTAHVVTREEAYASYLLAYGENNGCRADFDDNYRGTIYLKDLPLALQQDMDSQDDELEADGMRTGIYRPAISDWGTGMAIQVMAAPEQALFMEAYDDACE